jgi:phosphopantothenate---cysteine ligase (ATP)
VADRWIRLPAAGKREVDERIDGVIKDEPLDPRTLPEGDPEMEIEGLIIPAVKEMHDKYIKEFGRRQKK